MNIILRAVVYAGTIFVFLLVGLSSSFAVQPVTREFEIKFKQVIATCNGFDVLADETFNVRVTTFFDDDGRPVRRQDHVRFTGTFTNSVTGFSVTDAPDPFLFVRDFANGGFSTHGLTAKITVPGRGIVLLDAGTVIVAPDGTVTAHGPHVLDVNAALCDAVG